jgi:hypothetical protein
MGLRSWLGLDGPEEQEESLPGPPTTDELLRALDHVEDQARSGGVPGVVLSRLLRVTRAVRDTLPRLDRLGPGSTQGFSVMATATDYLPVAVGNYLRLPREWADTRPIAGGKSSVMLLVDQLDLLGATMDKVRDAVYRADAEAVVIHGAFLEQKFGQASTGGTLGLDSPDPDPDHEPADPQAPAVRPGPPAPGRLSPPGRLAPPEGR